MDELDALLGDLGKGLGSGSRISTAVGRGAPTTAPGPRANPQQAAMSSAAARPAPRPTSGLDDLDALVASLGGAPPATNSGAARSPAPAPAPAVQSPVALAQRKPAPAAASPSRATLTDVDDIDALMASLSLPASSGPQTKSSPAAQSQPRASIPAAAAPARSAAPAGGDALLSDLDALMASLGAPAPSTAASAPTAAAPRVNAPSMNAAPMASAAYPGSPGAGRGVSSPQPQMRPAPGGLAPSPVGAGAPAAQTPKGTCGTCQRPIQGPMMQALGCTYHPNCFICGSCGDSLGTGTFYQSDGKPTCARCYQAQFCARCAHCSKPIQGSCISAINKQWHVNCFICAQCLKPFGTSPYFERDGNPFCEGCFYGIFSSRCAGCDQPIKSDTVNACGRQWHPECFVCAHCRRAFAGQPYFEYGGRPYCQLHYHSQAGSSCGCGCGRPILGRVIQALGRQWLPEHFLCGFCMNSLAGQNFTQREGKAYCNGCFGKLFAP